MPYRDHIKEVLRAFSGYQGNGINTKDQGTADEL